MQKCSENLEVYHTAGRFFILFLGTIGAIQNGVQDGRQFRLPLEILKEGINKLFNKLIENQHSQYYMYDIGLTQY